MISSRIAEDRPPGIIPFSVGLVSAIGLASEILLMRIISIVEWQQFAWMIISLALLGFGASGSFLTLLRRPLIRSFDALAIWLPLAVSLSMIGCLHLALRSPFNSLLFLWEARQVMHLFVLYLTLSVPFFCIGAFIGLCLIRYPGAIGRLYGADLAGAGAGAALAMVLLATLAPVRAWTALSAAALGVSLLVALALRPRLAPAPLAAGAGLVLVSLFSPLQIEPNDYKPIRQALRIPEAEIIAERSSPLGLIQILSSPRVPLRQAPGLSLNWFEEIPEQQGVFVDGRGPILLHRPGDRLEYLAATTSAAARAVSDELPDDVLVIGLSGFPDLLWAWQEGVDRVELVEENGALLDLVGLEARGWGGELLDDARIRVQRSRARRHLAASPNRFDRIVIPFGRVPSEDAPSIAPDELLTAEGIQLLLRRLEPEGILSITAPVQIPPRTVPKMVATVAAALEGEGLVPDRRVAVLRGWDAATILVSRSPWTSDHSRMLRQFADAHSFDLVWLPDLQPSEVNRFNQLDRPWLWESSRRILEGADSRALFFAGYRFDVTPPTDDRPWFAHTLKWSTMVELLRLRERGGAALVQAGYPILLVTLVQAVVAGAILILLPLWLLRRPESLPGFSRWRIVVCFAALGLAFLALEIVYIHHLTLFLGRPIEATSVVLASFLVFAGVGSLASSRLRRRFSRPLLIFSVLVAVVAVSQIWLLDVLRSMAIDLPHGARVLVALIVIAPLAFAMGLPMPTALDSLREAGRRWIAWAWAINGCASVASAVLTVLISIHLGLTAVTLIAAGLYVSAGVALSGRREL